MDPVIDIPALLDRLCYRYPSMLVDAIMEHETGKRLVAVKNVTVNEEFFQGHFPGCADASGRLDARIALAGGCHPAPRSGRVRRPTRGSISAG